MKSPRDGRAQTELSAKTIVAGELNRDPPLVDRREPTTAEPQRNVTYSELHLGMGGGDEPRE